MSWYLTIYIVAEENALHNLEHAIKLAHQFHQGQKRMDGTDYVQHVVNVMGILKAAGFDEEELLIAAILHDACEDTDFSNLNLVKEFGERVGYVVNALSKNRKPVGENKIKKPFKSAIDDHGGKFNYRFWLYINRFASGIMDEPYILFVKMADQIDNLSSMEMFKPEKKKRKIDEIEECFIPIYDKAEKTLDKKYLSQYKKLRSNLRELIVEIKKSL